MVVPYVLVAQQLYQRGVYRNTSAAVHSTLLQYNYQLLLHLEGTIPPFHTESIEKREYPTTLCYCITTCYGVATLNMRYHSFTLHIKNNLPRDPPSMASKVDLFFTSLPEVKICGLKVPLIFDAEQIKNMQNTNV